MIVEPTTQDMTTDIPQESPPAYESVDANTQSLTKSPGDSKSIEATPLNAYYQQYPAAAVGPSTISPRPPQMPNVHHYVNPHTGERIESLLPPDHPEMLCLQAGEHVTETSFGLLGVLAAIFWFPLGIGLCVLDRRVRCRRCGSMLQDGLCS